MIQSSFVCALLDAFKYCCLTLVILLNMNGFNYSKLSNSYTGIIDETLTGITSLCQSEPGSNSNERVLHIFQKFKTGASPSDCFVSYPGYSLVRRFLFLCGDAVSVFYSPSWLVSHEVLYAIKQRNQTKFCAKNNEYIKSKVHKLVGSNHKKGSIIEL